MDAQPRRGCADVVVGRVGRDRYGDVQRVVGRGTLRSLLKVAIPEIPPFFFLTSPQLDLHNNLDIRDPSVHTQARTWVTDYFVGCHASEEEESAGLSVIVGSNEHVFLSPLFTPLSSFLRLLSTPLKGRRRAAQERGPARSRIALVFRAVMDRPSQRRRAISAPR